MLKRQYEQLDAVFAALSDHSRRTMVAQLVQQPASVTVLADPLAMSLSAVMQHLQVLEGCGLVSSHKHGRVRTCQIEPPALRAAEAWLSEQRTGWERQLDRLEIELADPVTAGPQRGDGHV